MATRHQVTCITPDTADTDQRIDAIGGSGFKYLIDDAISKIENKSHEFYTNVDSKLANVVVAQRSNKTKYLKTTADGVEPNNLLKLPRCG